MRRGVEDGLDAVGIDAEPQRQPGCAIGGELGGAEDRGIFAVCGVGVTEGDSAGMDGSAVGCDMGREHDGRATLAEAEGEMVRVAWVPVMAYAEPDEITPKAGAAAKVMMNGGIRSALMMSLLRER